MKWLTPVFPYLAVSIGIFWFHNAWIALLGFHFGIVISLFLARSQIPITTLFKSTNFRWVLLSAILCGSSGFSLYFLRNLFGMVSDLPTQIESFGLTESTWLLFMTYFVLVNPFVEEYFWRGFLGSPTKS